MHETFNVVKPSESENLITLTELLPFKEKGTSNYNNQNHRQYLFISHNIRPHLCLNFKCCIVSSVLRSKSFGLLCDGNAPETAKSKNKKKNNSLADWLPKQFIQVANSYQWNNSNQLMNEKPFAHLHTYRSHADHAVVQLRRDQIEFTVA